ncbi:MAG: glycosyltransferase family 2 protein [bacterium]|nr:glycosyltransferase family 2 protein [bacterium]
MSHPVFSIVVPIYNEEEVLPELYRRLTGAMDAQGETYELVFVNDGSRDRSLELLRGLADGDARLKVIDFARNFGHQAAITAGMDLATGDAVVVIDADLQDPPEVIARLAEKWREGYEVVYAIREKRQGDSLFKRSTAAAFYRLLRRVTSVDIPLDTGDFRLMDRRAIEAFKGLRERHRFVRGLVSWIGFRQTGVAFVRDERHAGVTKYPLRKMLKFAFDGLTSFSFAPLQLATYSGFVTAFTAFLGILWVVWVKLFTTEALPGWASQIVCTLLLGGIQLISLGIIGEYIGRIYDEVKGRPLYITREILGNASRTDTPRAPGPGAGATFPHA